MGDERILQGHRLPKEKREEVRSNRRREGGQGEGERWSDTSTKAYMKNSLYDIFNNELMKQD